MKRTLIATIAFGWVASAGPLPALAGSAVIETTAPLAEHSEAAVKVAVMVAIDKAARGAVAMGYPWIQLREAHIAGDVVAVQILATDVEPGSPAAGSPGESPEVTDDQDLGEDLPSEDRVPATMRLNV